MMALLHFASQSRANGFDLSGATHSCLPRRLLLDTVFLSFGALVLKPVAGMQSPKKHPNRYTQTPLR